MKKILFIYTIFACICFCLTAYATDTQSIETTISEITEITYDKPVTALTIPSSSNNYTVVNMRSDADINSDILGMVEMYARVTILGEKGQFYSVEGTCTDNGTRTGYISKQYVKPYSIIGTAYVNVNGEYDFSYATCYRYPDSSSAGLIKIEPNTNVNVLYTVDHWKYCQFNQTYGFIDSDRLVFGWYTHQQISDFQKNTADEIIKNSIIFMPNDKTAIINGKPTEVVQPVIKYYGKTMIPVKSLDTFWGAVLDWNNEEKSATINISDKIFRFTNESSVFYINNTEKDLGSEAFIRNDRLYVPIRTVCDELGINIYYFGEGVPFIAYKGETDYVTAQYIIDTVRHNFANSEFFEWPVPASSEISSGFGDGRNHKGIDITAPHGTPVVACADGVISEIYDGCTHNYPKNESCCGGGYGNYIVIVHEHTIDGSVVYTRYSHLESINVEVGQYVTANEHVGNVGCTGRSTGFHLDFELTIDNVKTDPASYIKVPANLHDTGNTGLYTKPYIDKLLATQPTF